MMTDMVGGTPLDVTGVKKDMETANVNKYVLDTMVSTNDPCVIIHMVCVNLVQFNKVLFWNIHQ